MLSKSDTLKLINSIAKRGKSLDNDIQQAAISSVYYSVCFGDVTIGQKLVENFPSGSRKAAVVGFLEKFGQFEYKAKTVVYRQRTFDTVLLENAEASEAYCSDIKVHWTAFKPEQIKSDFDLIDASKLLIARMEKAVNAGTAKHAELYDVMAHAFNTYMEEQADELEGEEQPQGEQPQGEQPQGEQPQGDETVLTNEENAELAELLRAA